MVQTGQETRARIIDAARKRLSNRSAQFVNLREIAMDAAVAPSAIIHYFGSKEELVLEVRLFDLEDAMAGSVAAAAAHPAGLPRFIAALQNWMERTFARPWEMRDLQQGSWQWTRDQHQRYLERVRPMDQLCREALRAEWALAPDSHADQLDMTVYLVRLLFEASVRKAFAQGDQAETAIREFTAHTSRILAGAHASILRSQAS